MLDVGAMITLVKETASAAKAAGKIDLYEKIVDLHSRINELQAELQSRTIESQEMHKRVAELKASLQFSKSLTFNGVWYFSEGDPYPFCPNCWESKKAAIHLSHSTLVGSGERRDCRNCERTFIDVSKAQPQSPQQIATGANAWMR
jgi:transcriptional regulator NrdR family protein